MWVLYSKESAQYFKGGHPLWPTPAHHNHTCTITHLVDLIYLSRSSVNHGLHILKEAFEPRRIWVRLRRLRKDWSEMHPIKCNFFRSISTKR